MRIPALTLAAFLLAPGHTAVDELAMIGVGGEGAKCWPLASDGQLPHA